MNMIEDQQTLPDDLREQVSPRHPNARKELWMSQEKLKELDEMTDPEWYPHGTAQNVYNKAEWKRTVPARQENDPFFF